MLASAPRVSCFSSAFSFSVAQFRSCVCVGLGARATSDRFPSVSIESNRFARLRRAVMDVVSKWHSQCVSLSESAFSRSLSSVERFAADLCRFAESDSVDGALERSARQANKFIYKNGSSPSSTIFFSSLSLSALASPLIDRSTNSSSN